MKTTSVAIAASPMARAIRPAMGQQVQQDIDNTFAIILTTHLIGLVIDPLIQQQLFSTCQRGQNFIEREAMQ